MISGIIFDYGGTIDSRGEHWSEVIWRGWQRAGIPATKQAFRDSYVYAERYLARHPVILPSDDFRTLLLKKITIELNHFYSAHQQPVSTTRIDVLRQPDGPSAPAGPEMTPEIAQAIADYCDTQARICIAEARPTLEALANRYPLCLVSNFYGNIVTVLEAYGIRHLFSHIIESAVVGVRKPDPRIFQLGCVALGLPPEQVLVVGDSLTKDILPAESLGCATAWLKGRGWSPADDAATHPSQITALSDLMKNEK